MPFAAPLGTTLVGPLGAGSTCDVARVRTDAGLSVACKRLLPQHRTSHAARVALAREARALELARHPSIPVLIGVGSDACGPFVLESLVEGPSLREVKAHWRGRVPFTLACHASAEAARILRELHALADEGGPVALVHGDVAPDNLRLGAFGAVGILDFGHARTRSFTRDLDTGALGTPPYLAPELVRGEAVPTASTDVYALAATAAWLLLDGEQPLVGASNDAAMWLEIGERGLDPARFAALPNALVGVLSAMLRPDPAARQVDLATLERTLASIRPG